MGILGNVAGIFGGNAGADEISKYATESKDFYKTNQADERTQIDPYLGAGRQGVDYLTRFLSGGTDYVGPAGQSIIDKVIKDVTGKYAAMGLSDSGPGRAAVTDAITRAILGIRGQVFGEGATVAGLGQNAISQLIHSNQIASGGVERANESIGTAKAGAKINMFNQLGGIGDTLLNASAGGFGGAFKPGLYGKIAGSFA